MHNKRRPRYRRKLYKQYRLHRRRYRSRIWLFPYSWRGVMKNWGLVIGTKKDEITPNIHFHRRFKNKKRAYVGYDFDRNRFVIRPNDQRCVPKKLIPGTWSYNAFKR